MREMTDEELRQLWRSAGGDFHGPRVETGTMPESALLPFLRQLAVAQEPKRLSYKPLWLRAAVEAYAAYWGRFAVPGRGLCGPIDEEMRALGTQLIRQGLITFDEKENSWNMK